MPYSVAIDNPHFKSLYSIDILSSKNKNEYTLIAVGLDRRISFWNFLLEDIVASFKLDWKINFLGGKVQCLAHSKREKNFVIFSENKNGLKVWDLEKKVKKKEEIMLFY